MTTDDLPLAAEFPPATRAQWLKLVEGVLKGAPFEKKLVHRTYDGLKIEPLYERVADARPVPGRTPGAPWQVMARVDHPDPREANRQALEDLENGAHGLVLVCPGSVGAQGFGIDASAEGLARILDGVYLDAGAPIEFQLTRAAKDLPDRLLALIKARRLDPAGCDLRVGFDPIGLMAAGSSAPLPWSGIAPHFAGKVRALANSGLRGPFAAADARLIHNAGGAEAQELGYALSVALAYLRALEADGVALADARRMIFFRLSADADQFLTMAKFRSLRKLWARVEEACGLAPAPAFVAAETAWRMMTRRDPYVNMLRVTIAAFAAGLGGADAVTVLPFTSALGLPDAAARRIARNTQLVLLEESNLAKVADPAAGAGGIEDLTDQLCRAAWSFFQEIEAAGGITTALERGLLQGKVAQTRRAREKAIAMRKEPLTGTSEFPHLDEAPIKVLMPSPPPSETNDENSSALPCIRLAEPYEALRDASDRALDKTGARPKVFLATLGTPADHIARAMFAKNFFAAGGIEAVESASPLPIGERSTPKASGEGEPCSIGNGPSPGPPPAAPDRPLPMGEVESEFAALAESFKQSGARLACLCSSDEVYAAQGPDAAKALAAAGATHIYLAGRPGESADSLQKAGVGIFIFAGCDALSTLQAAHDNMNAKG